MTAIRFAEWIGSQGYTPIMFENEVRWLMLTGDDNSINHRDFMTSKTTAQLYSLYLESL